MTIDATFWLAISFFIFFAILIYLKVPQKMNNSLTDKINEIKKFQRSSVDNINKIAAEISNEVIKNTLGSQGNMSNITAVVEEISKTKLKKYL